MSFVDRLAERIGPGDDVGRRGFLGRAALVGSAVAVAPVRYLTRPVEAGEVVLASNAVCGREGCAPGSQCCDGYTEFCCSMYGENRCPPGSITGGWWKVDSSTYCSARGEVRPRYYLDCHKTCGGCPCAGGTCSGACNGTRCGCGASSDTGAPNLGCGHRKAGCTRFRYGQCNQHIGCVGPILCRVVTCVEPWRFDTACTRATLTDNNTRWHDAGCLHAAFSDTVPGAYYEQAVEWAVANGITGGVDGRDLFFPDRPATRSDIVQFMWRFMDRPPGGPHDVVNPEGTRHHDAVSWAAGAGIVTGYAGTRGFGPDARCTRAHAVSFLARMMGNAAAPPEEEPPPDDEPPPEDDDTDVPQFPDDFRLTSYSPSSGVATLDHAPAFRDVDPSAYYAPHVQWAVHHDITRGVGDGLFRPNDPVTRAQAVTFLWRIAGRPALWQGRTPPSTVRF